MPIPSLAHGRDRVLGGVCAGIAHELSVDPTLVRLVFAVLALAGGAGIVLYLALWFALEPKRRAKRWQAVVAVVIAASVVLHGFGLSATAVLAIALIGGGFALIWRRGASLRAGEPFSLGGRSVNCGRGSTATASSARAARRSTARWPWRRRRSRSCTACGSSSRAAATAT